MRTLKRKQAGRRSESFARYMPEYLMNRRGFCDRGEREYLMEGKEEEQL
jgi:hypothetical protein